METVTTYIKKDEGTDYRFIEDRALLDLFEVETGGTTPIELLNGDYNGIMYCYGKTNIAEKGDNIGSLSFQFKVLNRTDEEKAILRKDEAFIRHLGEILNSIIIDDLDAA